ncbi:MAG: hypothetical protein QW410_00205 [Nitrososphaerota archaeon]
MEEHRAVLKGIILTCEHCGKEFVWELNAPMAVRCTECNSVFDARMQLVRGLREEVKRMLGET